MGAARHHDPGGDSVVAEIEIGHPHDFLFGHGPDAVEIVVFPGIAGQKIKGADHPGLAFHPLEIENEIALQIAFDPIEFIGFDRQVFQLVKFLQNRDQCLPELGRDRGSPLPPSGPGRAG